MIWVTRGPNLPGATIEKEVNSPRKIGHGYVLPVQCSDHNPLLISCQNRDDDLMPRRKIFKYEVSLARKEDCAEVIKSAWGCTLSYSNKAEFIKKGLDRCRDILVGWSKTTHGNRRKIIH